MMDHVPLCGMLLVLLVGGAQSTTCGEEQGDNWVDNNGRYYLLRTSPVDYFTARSKCQQLGATLAIVKGSTESTYLQKLLAENEVEQAWLGLAHKLDSNKNADITKRRKDWQWDDQTELSSAAFNDWKSDEPQMDDDCAVLVSFTADKNYGWLGQKCGTTESYLCERGSPWECHVYECQGPSEWRLHDDSCYRYFHQKERRFEANRLCKQHEAEMVSITDQQESDLVHSITTPDDDDVRSSWIGLSIFPEYCSANLSCFLQGNWKWASDLRGQIQWRNWAPHDQLQRSYKTLKQSSSDEMCATTSDQGTIASFWRLTECSFAENYVVCEKKASLAADPNAQLYKSAGSTLLIDMMLLVLLLLLNIQRFIYE